MRHTKQQNRVSKLGKRAQVAFDKHNRKAAIKRRTQDTKHIAGRSLESWVSYVTRAISVLNRTGKSVLTP